ncbi:MAG: exodeoxyribonuclease V subunit beta, partial [Pseudomonadota bacterium]
AIRGQYPVALIDEFQDTDPAQYAVFDAVYDVAGAPEDRGLFLIGDPKQAIYGFRGADIHSYLAARRATAGRHYTLPRNFRATTAAVAAVNRLFGHAADHRRGAFLFGTEGEDPVPFHPVAAQGRKERLLRAGEPVPALTLWHRRPSEAVAMGPYRDEAAEAGATAITDLLIAGRGGAATFQAEDGSARAVEPADIAVLVRDRQEAEAIRSALAARGVATVYLSLQDSVWDSEEAGDLHLWLRACAEPESEAAVRAALATPTLGYPLAELERLTRDEAAWERAVLRFHDYRRIWRHQGVLPLLRRLLHDEGVPGRLLALADGERRLTNLLHLGELLQQAAAGLEGEHALLRHLAAEREGGGSGEDRILRLESDADRVRVVTIHKAKGLEYPLVFLPFASAFRPVDRSRAPLRYRDEGGSRVIDPEPDDEAVARADDERLAEDLRLFYVALTRARHATWVGLAPVKRGRKKENDFHRTAPGYLLAGGEPIEPGDLPQRLAALAEGEPALAVAPFPEPDHRPLPPAADIAPAGEARTPHRAPAERWWIASYSALAPGHEAGPESAPAPETATAAVVAETAGEGAGEAAGGGGLLDFPRGPEPGTFLHGLLEWAAGEGLAATAADPEGLAETVAGRCRRRGWGDHAPAVTDWLRRLLTEPLALPDSEPVRLAELGQYQPELEFWLGVHHLPAGELDAAVRAATLAGEARPPVGEAHLNGLLKGFIDLVFEHDGRYWVADYKSNFLGPRPADYAPAALRAAVLERRYDLQYTLYTLALHRQLTARLPGYDYDTHMGGAVYLFLRGLDAPGQGLHCERPPRELIEGLDARLRGRQGGGAP